MNGIAKNAAQSEVVQSFTDLPEHLQKRYADNAETLEAVYDPSTKKVWFVAVNLASVERAADVWTHEQVVHNGLREMLTESGRRTLLNQLWLNFGGMGNSLVKEIAERYGLKPRRNLNDRLTVMEEVIAKLAEDRKLGNLDGKEQTFWKKIVRAIANAWNRVVEKITGKNTGMGMEQVDKLLSALGKYVIDCIPAGNMRGEMDGAMASVGNGETNSYGVPMERVIQIEKPFTREEAQQALELLQHKDLPNKLEGITAQVNREQRDKMTSDKARYKSVNKGFTAKEHYALAAQIAKAWEWAAKARTEEHRSQHSEDSKIHKFVAAVSMGGKDSFAWLTAKESQAGLRLYSAELLNEKKLREIMETRSNDNATVPVRSYEQIISRLSGPVNEKESPLASIGKDIS